MGLEYCVQDICTELKCESHTVTKAKAGHDTTCPNTIVIHQAMFTCQKMPRKLRKTRSKFKIIHKDYCSNMITI